ncbi:MAG: ATP-binding cassette domain-containing protein [Actinobacteria bacterium]|nr:ATP-binding cassette domain-containing protein [Actinomycetota bacterium]
MSTIAQTLTIDHLSKRFGKVHAVRDLSFTVEPGRVTGFLGPNGSGKTTTLRCLLGLVRPSDGTASIGGQPYRDLDHPGRVVGAALEASGFHPGRTARGHLRVIADALDLPKTRVDEVLGLVGLEDAAGRKAGGFSLGMRQRLSLAAALVGDPGILILDEPANGLDPEGIAWLRGLLRGLAREGRTVLVSSHVLSEVQQTVDDVVIISKGALVRAGSLADLAGNGAVRVRVRSPRRDALIRALEVSGEGPPPTVLEPSDDGELLVTGLTASDIGRRAFLAGVELHELTQQTNDLESLFLELTATGTPGGTA